MNLKLLFFSFQWKGVEDATISDEKRIEYRVTLKERVSNNKHVVACDLVMFKEKVKLPKYPTFSISSHCETIQQFSSRIQFKKPLKGG